MIATPTCTAARHFRRSWSFLKKIKISRNPMHLELGWKVIISYPI